MIAHVCSACGAKFHDASSFEWHDCPNPAPAVKTVADLTWQHIGERVRVELINRTVEGELFGFAPTGGGPGDVRITVGVWSGAARKNAMAEVLS